MKKLSLAAVSLSSMLWGCGFDQAETGLQLVSLTYDFSTSEHGWKGGFCDYPATSYDSIFYELRYEHTNAPSEIDQSGKAIMLSGSNHSDDLFMYLKRKIVNLAPNEDYFLTYEITLASNAADESFGAGGSPGGSVFLKVGASDIEPRSVIQDGQYVMNIDKGNQIEDGADMVTIGDVGGPSDGKSYVLITRTNGPDIAHTEKVLVAHTNNKGELWLIVGTDSGFEGTTTLYYTSITAVLSRSN
ncbi:MAG TPA: hypothetical protein VD927_09735 [Chryseosolibacter sp.]|nr:hypothetical protein [Chryseosolibacter sp.]